MIFFQLSFECRQKFYTEVRQWNFLRGLSIELSGVKRIRIHGFRHSYVSMCAHLGATPVVIAHLIGDTIETVMQVYTYIWADDGSEIVLRINRLASETMAQNWHRL